MTRAPPSRRQGAGLAMMAAVALLGFSGGQASAQQVVERFPSSGSAPASIVESVRVPPGAEMLILSGQTASRADAPDRSVSVDLPPAALGDTKTQTINILSKIRAALRRRGYALADVVKLTVYLVGDPANGGGMDYAGMNEGYRQFFGTLENPNLVARATVQVVALAEPAFLVEIEATAVRMPAKR